jgi:DNA mismatch repair protein MutS
MTSYQEQIRHSTGIKNLKVGFSKFGGFFIEVSKGQVDKVPPEFKRRQTLTNAERYITAPLKDYEEKILHAEDQIIAVELRVFQELKHTMGLLSREILQTAQSIALIDALVSLSQTARINHYTRPKMDLSGLLIIKDGRHPVIETSCIAESFTPNNTHLDGVQEKMMLITGPNMAGKSTYIRQVALIAILAHMGSFVPASFAHIGLLDQVFTRIGASDDLARGQSTFMVEMSETAAILHNATSSSLVILDEIGRGTSTYDGIALAWSIAEHLLTTAKKSPKTLFATHYWELTQLQEQNIGAVNYNVAVHERGNEVLFLRKIVKGGAHKSYGIHVAKLAGIPATVLNRSQEILQHLENGKNINNLLQPPKNKRVITKKSPPSPTEYQLKFI